MGQQDVAAEFDPRQLRAFMRAVLNDLRALEQLIEAGRVETGVRRMNARGGELSVHIKGVDEVNVTSDNIMPLSSNTSFQVHLQVGPDEFAALYNVAQAVTAPVLAAAVNSPLWLGRRRGRGRRARRHRHRL